MKKILKLLKKLEKHTGDDFCHIKLFGDSSGEFVDENNKIIKLGERSLTWNKHTMQDIFRYIEKKL